MTFPQTIRDITVELFIDGAWVGVDGDPQQRGAIIISRGVADEGGDATPQTCGLMLDDRTLKYSPRNPLSPYYGKFGRNTPLRVTVNGSNRRYYGETSELPPKRDVSGHDVWVPLSTAGQLRRLQRGKDSVDTALASFIRGIDDSTGALGSYFPLDGADGTTYSLNLAKYRYLSTKFEPRNSPTYTYGTDMGPFIGSGMELNATGDANWMTAGVKKAGQNAALDFVFQSPNVGDLTIDVYDMFVNVWTLKFHLDTVVLDFIDPFSLSVTNLLTSGVQASLVDTGPHVCRLQLFNGADPQSTDWEVFIDGVSIGSGNENLPSNIVGIDHYNIRYTRTSPETVINLAHMTMWCTNTVANIPDAADFTAVALGHVGETAADRMVRVAEGMGTTVTIVGDAADTMPMGPQSADEPFNVIRDAVTADQGILYELRDQAGLAYRTRVDLYNQTPTLTLDYSLHQLDPPFEPTDDDQYTRNDITVSNKSGGSYRVTKDTGRMSVNDPPDGVGLYRDSETVNLASDDLLPPVAGWLLGKGTIDAARYPTIGVRLEARAILAAGLEANVLAVDIGDMVRLTNLDATGVYDDVDLIVLGYTETLNAYEHSFVFNCVPASVYVVANLGGTTTRLGTGDVSLLQSSITTTATSMSVKSNAVGPDPNLLWATTGLPVRIMVDGEEMNLTAVSGTTPGSAQTFTVTRSMNGVVKSHSASAVVRLKQPMRLGL